MDYKSGKTGMSYSSSGLPPMAQQRTFSTPMPVLQPPTVIGADGQQFGMLERAPADLGEIAPGCGGKEMADEADQYVSPYDSNPKNWG